MELGLTTNEKGQMNIFLTGLPGIGKTTIIKKVIEKLNRSTCGFFTTEEKEGETRVGFKVETLFGMQGMLAHKELKSKYRVGNYGIAVTGFEKIVSRELERCLRGSSIIIIDEIGRMELFSRRFQELVLACLDAPNPVLGTIMHGYHPYVEKVKKREDVKIFEVTKQNRNQLVDLLVKELGEEKLSSFRRE
jgi:nucleoside-triphosphatase